MSQSRKASALEAVVNILVGYTVAVTAQILIFPLFDVHLEPSSHLLIGVAFTFVSLARSYLLRRLFNRFTGGKSGSTGS